jgi:hypothetical protein
MAFNNISKLLSLVFFKSFNLSPSQSLGLTGNFEPLIIALANIRNATNIPRSHRISNSKIGNMLEVELTHMERAPSAALTKIEDIYFKMTQTKFFCNFSFFVRLYQMLRKPFC